MTSAQYSRREVSVPKDRPPPPEDVGTTARIRLASDHDAAAPRRSSILGPQEQALLGEKARMEQVDREYARPRAQRWAGQNPGNALIREEAFGILHEAAGSVLASHRPVLDMGCGNGSYLMSLAARGMPEENLYGVDL